MVCVLYVKQINNSKYACASCKWAAPTLCLWMPVQVAALQVRCVVSMNKRGKVNFREKKRR